MEETDLLCEGRSPEQLDEQMAQSGRSCVNGGSFLHARCRVMPPTIPLGSSDPPGLLQLGTVEREARKKGRDRGAWSEADWEDKGEWGQ